MLDVTRLVRRAGRVRTGVDRVEYAYLDHFLSLETPVYFLSRTSLGFVLMDREGGLTLRDRLNGVSPWGFADLLSRLSRRSDPKFRRVESDLRRICLARSVRHRLTQMLLKKLPVGFDYFNVGHTNLDDDTLSQIRKVGSINVLLHDVIPLEFPQYQRPGTVGTFRTRMQAIQKHADRIIYNSSDTEARATAVLGSFGTAPPGIVAHLGLDLAENTERACVSPPSRAFFMTIGTIEPRKDHGLLLDVWEDMIRSRGSQNVPLLLICGSRGWNNEAVFARLDRLPPDGPVRELSDLDDTSIAVLLRECRGLLFPSHAEGYGLPPIEAAALGCPVVCRDLPIYREILGNIPVYVESRDSYLWRSVVENLETDAFSVLQRRKLSEFSPPKWDDHFNLVLRPHG